MGHHTSQSADLNTPLSSLRGVGPKLCEKLTRLGLHTVEDLLYTLPHRYEDRRHFSTINQLKPGEPGQFRGKILNADEVPIGRGRQKLFEVVVGDDTGQMLLKWFHYRRDWMKKNYTPGRIVQVYGEVRFYSGRREILHPEIDFNDATDSASLRILPVYPLTEGLSQKQLRNFCQQAVADYADSVPTHLPEWVMKKRDLLPLNQALLHCHCPPVDSDFLCLQQGQDPARRTLVYDEFFYLQLGLTLRRQGVQVEQGRAFTLEHRYTQPLAKALPFSLTAAQKRVLGEIKQDMLAPHPMNRLIQGDVGSGKTIVALMAALIAVENGAQAAVLAPTEILAEQHYNQFHHWMTQLGLHCALLTGSTPKSERQTLLDGLAHGEIKLLVGTHAILQPDVTFADLGLVIIDEQHRFGVQQRHQLRKKGHNPDTLVMTATPIPRTLSLTLYGDLAMSVIDELPPGRTPITTRIARSSQRPQLLDFVRRELDKGHQVYFVYPLVEESERSELKAATEAFEALEKELGSEYSGGLLHGRLHPRDKEAVMDKFKQGQIHYLVATTVIEVGIDVPNASAMVIEHAERFGLAQLHQLRGRVGRGAAKSYCVLVPSEQCSHDGQQRLNIMQSSNDGFVIAEADLELRGPGEFLGTRQAGIENFRVANLLRDASLLEQAREDALQLIEQDDFLTSPQYYAVRETLKQRWGSRLELASVG
ncbi:ATP-dependent DNA helicase RecG [Desulfuromonas acetoxidans]|uniref:ATP-dependent DNA helicase RecG n=1 Tax=Desulfuromonas acetoxidans (strain DSM 684 / 11070) TaxID=281689 RepID=Q1K1T1_DESA6|nr:ATP-dependent DNA helicase RecG [Desulfuromonas acetoxidans]EAT16307.1 ATP-dependent DNA helicase RecG [Desulfuromonas acetoxidans DSM 684]MBF0644886.1 ATP-dependent DNA helicase RecG [Desulfuromonas acetoxidans]NVD25403.1 ATP-dependent DNA helicase RecG [Desulfuromonas acetoxidans]NVE17496.1 ATP-dependent DNA helicase RecG [Desulfuromonas acetoxidans]